MTDASADAFDLPAATRIGRVALRVGSFDALVPFYRGLGFDVERQGTTVTALANGIDLLVFVADQTVPARPNDAAGLFHLAVRVPDRGALAAALERIRAHDLELTGASDHLASEALYLRDPEGNGVEVYRDRPRDEWPWTDDGGVALDTLPLDLDDLATASNGEAGDEFPAETDIGHVHLEVTDLDRSEAFYRDALGMRLRARYGGSGTFLAAGDYHHHLGLNVWNGRTAPATGRGLDWFELQLPDVDVLETLEDRLATRGHAITDIDSGIVVEDPDGIRIKLVTERAP